MKKAGLFKKGDFVSSKSPHLKKILDKGLPFILSGIFFLIIALASYNSYTKTEESNLERFRNIKVAVSISIQNRIQYYQNSLQQTAAFFMSSASVTQEEFLAYANNIEVVGQYPGMVAVAYAELATGDSLKAPVKYIQPFSPLSKSISGADMLANEKRRNAIMKSAAQGAPVAVTQNLQIRLADTSVKNDGFYLFYPVYNTTSIPNAEEARKRAHKGQAFGIFNNQNLFNIIYQENGFFQEAVAFTIQQKSSEASAAFETVYNSRDLYNPVKNHESMFEEKTILQVADKKWTLTVSSLPSFEEHLKNNLWWQMLLIGAFLSFLVCFVAWKDLKNTKELKISEKRARGSAQSNALLAQAGKTLGANLDTQTNMEKFTQFLANNFADCCVIHFSEEGDFRPIFKLSKEFDLSRPEASEEKLQEKCLEFIEKSNIKERVLKEETEFKDNDPSSDMIKSFLALPLIIRGKLYKIITLINLERQEPFSREDTKLLGQMANLGSVSIENTLLYKEAQLANRLKDEFLATVSHELRTPLNVIYGHSQLLLELDLGSDERTQVEAIFRSAKAQSAIIDDLLDVSSIISGKLNFQPRPVKIIEAIDTAVESVELEAKKKGIELIYEESSQAIIMGVKTRLVQILWNLLSNSIKFTPEGGKIAIKTKVEDEKCVIKIMDTGKGIDPAFLPFIFEKFRQEEKASTRSKGGLGLGLSIVSHLVDLHGGGIQVESEGLNKGTTFTLSFPLVSLTARSAPREESQKIKDIKRHDLHDISILAVDDEPDTLNLLTRILRGQKATVIPAGSAKEALKKMKQERPDVLISDIAMPEMDGYELIKEVRKKEKGLGTHIPAIALTAFAQEEDKDRALKSGYEAYLTKPVNKEKLIDTVEKTLQ